MFKIKWSKNLSRLEFLKAQIAVAIITLLMLPAVMFPPFLVFLLYPFLLSLSNITGRLRNISNRDLGLVWGVYFVMLVIPYFDALCLLIFFLPSGIFNKKKE